MRLIRSLLVVALTLLLVPIGASPARAADGTITGVALDPTGKPLPNVYWELYTWEGGEWTTLQFGPKLTDSEGRFSHRVPVGGQYRVCFSDSYYGVVSSPTDFWQPEVRHRDTCWPNASSFETARTWTSTAAAPSKTFSVTLRERGLGMAPVDPFIVGSYQPGDPLTIVGQEGWRPTNATFSYQWMSQREGSPVAPIPGATSPTFVPTEDESGAWVFASVTASLPGYKPATLTTPVSQVGTTHVELTAPLTITGSAEPGGTLTASFGRPPSTYSELSWFVDGVPQPQLTSRNSATSQFPVSAAHSGARIDARLMIYAVDPEGNYVDGSDTYQRFQVQVAGSRPVQSLPAAPAPVGQPTVGRVLSAPTGLTADPEAEISYQWVRGATVIAGATASRYQVRRVDVNKRIKVRMTVSRPGWWNDYVSTSTPTVAKLALKNGKVRVIGKARVGKRLTARAVGWGPKPVKVRYQWMRNGKLVRGATKARYQVRKVDHRKVLKVRITVAKPNHLTVVKTSAGRKVRR